MNLTILFWFAIENKDPISLTLEINLGAFSLFSSLAKLSDRTFLINAMNLSTLLVQCVEFQSSSKFCLSLCEAYFKSKFLVSATRVFGTNYCVMIVYSSFRGCFSLMWKNYSFESIFCFSMNGPIMAAIMCLLFWLKLSYWHAWLSMSIREGSTLKVGCEWYHPTISVPDCWISVWAITADSGHISALWFLFFLAIESHG